MFFFVFSTTLFFSPLLSSPLPPLDVNGARFLPYLETHPVAGDFSAVSIALVSHSTPLPMSYFSYAPSSATDYDMPHPTLSRNQPRFYIPDRSTYSPGGSAAAPGEHLSLHSRFPSVSTSGQSTPYRGSIYGQSSRASITALRHALHHYKAYAPRDRRRYIAEPATPQHQLSRVPRGQCPPPPGDEGGPLGLALALSDDAIANLPPNLWGTATDPMEAVIDIHRVLYRGSDDISASWSEQGREIQRVVDQWFEGDCGGLGVAW